MKITQKDFMMAAGVFIIVGFFLGGWAMNNSNNRCQADLEEYKIALNESITLNKECVTGYYYCAKEQYNFSKSERAIFDYLLNESI